MAQTVRLDECQEALLTAAKSGGPVHVSGPPGTGKTTVAVAAMLSAPKRSSDWVPGLIIAPDRRRAAFIEAIAAKNTQGDFSDLRARGTHRLVRSLNSYAYLVLGLWSVEREQSMGRPHVLSGADEDLWIRAFLERNAAEDGSVGGFSLEVQSSDLFPMELRNVISRSGEAGLLPADLEWLSQEADIPFWNLSATAYEQLAGDEHAFTTQTKNIDAARLPRIAADVLRNWTELANKEEVIAAPPIPGRIVVDDAQDLPFSALPLLLALSDLGAQVIITSNEDEASAAFRGGVASMGRLLRTAIPGTSVALNRQYRTSMDVESAVRTAASWLPHAGGSDPVDCDAGAPSSGEMPGRGRVYGQRVATSSHMSERVAAILREHRLHNKGKWNKMAVVVRHSNSVEAIQRSLLRHNVPIQSGQRPVVLAKIPVVAAMLSLLAEPDSETEPNEEQEVLDLLVSPLIGADPLKIHRVRRDFQASQTQDRPATLSALLSAVGEGTFKPSGPDAAPILRELRRASRIWQQRVTAKALPVQEALWDLWEASQVAERFRADALTDGPNKQRAVEALDGVLALFRKADLWVQALPEDAQATGAAFATEILAQEVSTDPLVPSGLAEEGVWVVTPTQAAGRQWDIVVIADLEEGIWPGRLSTRLSSISQLDALFMDARERGWPGEVSIRPYLPDVGVTRIDRPTLSFDNRVDEARLFLVALSRSTGDVHMISIENDKTTPSAFFQSLVASGTVVLVEESSDPTQRRSLTISGLISRMRRTLADEATTADQKRDAARVLGLLWKEGVPDADPGMWGTSGSLSTTNPVLEQGPIRLGPSSIRTAGDCALRWFLGDIGGRDQEQGPEPGMVDAATLGMFVHTLAEQNPHAGPSEMREAADQLWEQWELGSETYWEKKARSDVREWAGAMGAHFASVKGEVLTEQPLRFTVDGAVISGRADRVEIDEAGTARIIDIKTGNLDGRDKAPENEQLKMYQIGVTELGFETGGAALLALREKQQLRLQEPMSAQEIQEARDGISALLPSLGGAKLEANPLTGDCRTCPFRHVCPAMDESARSTE